VNRGASAFQRWQRLGLVVATFVAATAGRVVAQNSPMPVPRWWPSSDDALSRLSILGSAFQCPIGHCDRAAALGADARVSGSFHVAVDARMPGFDYTAWYGWRRVSIGATVGNGTTLPLIAVLRAPTMTSQAGTANDTLHVRVDSAPPDSASRHAKRWSSTAARLTWREDRWWVTGLVGRVSVAGQGAAPWAGLQLGANITDGASLLLGLGTTSRIAALAAPEPLRHNLQPWPGFNASILSHEPRVASQTPAGSQAAFMVSNVGVDSVRITIRAPFARKVEFASDCTGWKPFGMVQTHDGWVVDIAAPRGLHRANIRVDGGRWISPPGLASSDDDFAGEVGVFVVE